MNSENQNERSLRDLELEVETEGREWMRRRLEQKLQAQAERVGSVFPPRGTAGVASAAGADASGHDVRPDRPKSVARKKSG